MVDQAVQNQEVLDDPDKDHDEFMKNFSEISEEKPEEEKKEDDPPKDPEQETPPSGKEDAPAKPDSSADNKSGDQDTGGGKPKQDADYWKAEAEKASRELETERQKTSSWAGRISAANKKLKEAEEKAAAAEKRAAELAERAKSSAKVTPPEDSDPDEEEAVQRFLTEFPDLEKPLRALIRREAGVRSKKGETVEVPPEKLAESTTTSEIPPSGDEPPITDEDLEHHWELITAKHPDAKTLKDEVKKWIDQQPTLLKKAYSGYYQQGTASEIIEMLDLFKADVAKQKTKSKEIKDKHAQALETVPHDPGGPTYRPEVDKNDFDSAFREFAAEEEKKSSRR